MDASYLQGMKSRRYITTFNIANLHHYKHDCLFCVLDLQLHELNVMFDEENNDFLKCVSCLGPSLSFIYFYVNKLLITVELYSNDFVYVSEVVLQYQFQNYARKFDDI